MEREIREAHLGLAGWRLVVVERDIFEQVLKINELKREGQDDRQARKWLAELEELRQQRSANCIRLRRDFEGYRDGAEGEI